MSASLGAAYMFCKPNQLINCVLTFNIGAFILELLHVYRAGEVNMLADLFAHHGKPLDVEDHDIWQVTELNIMLGLGLFIALFTFVLIL